MDSLTPGVHSEDLSEGSGAQDCSINEAGVDCELERMDKAIQEAAETLRLRQEDEDALRTRLNSLRAKEVRTLCSLMKVKMGNPGKSALIERLIAYSDIGLLMSGEYSPEQAIMPQHGRSPENRLANLSLASPTSKIASTLGPPSRQRSPESERPSIPCIHPHSVLSPKPFVSCCSSLPYCPSSEVFSSIYCDAFQFLAILCCLLFF